MTKSPAILVINPGGTSTKVAFFRGNAQICKENIAHSKQELAPFENAIAQLDWRIGETRKFLTRHQIKIAELDGVSGRGGPLPPVPAGTFAIDETLLDLATNGETVIQHPSILGVPIAASIAAEAGCPAFIVDPVSVDEMIPAAKICGIPELQRKALSHALNIRAASREASLILGRPLEELKLIVAHLGSGFTIAAQKYGRQLDANDATASGPMAPTRAGTLPARDFMGLCFSGKYTETEIEGMLIKTGGWQAHLGTDDIREIYAKIDNGDQVSREVLDGTILQISKEICALMAVLGGIPDGIIFTGGVVKSERFAAELADSIKWINTQIIELPGEQEMKALAEGALRVLTNQETARRIGDYI